MILTFDLSSAFDFVDLQYVAVCGVNIYTKFQHRIAICSSVMVYFESERIVKMWTLWNGVKFDFCTLRFELQALTRQTDGRTDRQTVIHNAASGTGRTA